MAGGAMTKHFFQKTLVNLGSGALAGLFVFFVLNLIPFFPDESKTWLALGTAVSWVLNPILGVVVSIGLFIIPITYTSLTVAVIFLLFLLIVAVFDTWAVGPYGFLVLAAMVAILLQPELNFLILTIPLAAAFLGPRRGSILAVFGCFLSLTLGVIRGKPDFGLLLVEGARKQLLFLKAEPLGKLFGSGWLEAQTRKGVIDTKIFNAVLSPFGDHFVMLVQILFWGLAAGVTGYLLSRPAYKKIPSYVYAIPAGMLILTAGVIIAREMVSEPLATPENLWLPTLVPAALVLVLSPGLKWVAPFLSSSHQTKSDPGQTQSQNLMDVCALGADQKEMRKVLEGQFGRLGVKKILPARGMLLFGPAGTEKSRLARCLADEAKASLITVGKDTLTTSYYDVFVSYSTRDKVVADACVTLLESKQLRCWYAPRNIEAGADWGKEVTKAIGLSKMVLLIFSENSNHSQRVQDEINFAITQEIPILPFRIENAKPSDALMLHLSSRHWLDAYEPSWKEHEEDLLRLVQKMMDSTSPKKGKKPKEKADLKESLRKFFSEAQDRRPSILYFEELAHFASIHGEGSGDSIGITDTFLECMDELASTSGILVLGATETPEKIDPAVLESGRLEKLFYLPPPDQAVRREILTRYLADKPLAINVDLKKVAVLLKVTRWQILKRLPQRRPTSRIQRREKTKTAGHERILETDPITESGLFA
jgi:hypothetical protein